MEENDSKDEEGGLGWREQQQVGYECLELIKLIKHTASSIYKVVIPNHSLEM